MCLGRQGLRPLVNLVLALLLGGFLAGIANGARGATGPSGGVGIGRGGPPATRPHHGTHPHHATHPRRTSQAHAAPPVRGHTLRGNPFSGRGMWIWVVSASDGGDAASIIAQAHQYGVSTLFIKAGDGSSAWPQFSTALIATLHAAGLHVCGWQYVYGNHPITEAYVGAAAVSAGADCLVVDAESEYQGKYVQAQRYISRLRALIGAGFPVALAGFPYIDFHPGFPYSIFLGPGGAQYNVPQMYWREIGTTVDDVFAHTYAFNRIYQRPLFPLGQLYNNPPGHQIRRFRQLSRAYGAANVSWWDWQEARPGAWSAIGASVGPLPGFAADPSNATVGQGALGDLVVWAQEHLVSAGEPLTIDGAFGPSTLAAVQAFQTAHGLLATGAIDTATWQALLRYPPVRVVWTLSHKKLSATAAGATSTVASPPKSASAKPRGYEIPRSLGAGQP